MSAPERESFLRAALPAYLEAERTLHNGDVTARLLTWSHDDPVTLFGAGVPFRSGWAEMRDAFGWVASTFKECLDYDVELLAADAAGNLAYTVGIERYRARTSAGVEVRRALRTTHVYRQESDGWRIVHRHGDHMAVDA